MKPWYPVALAVSIAMLIVTLHSSTENFAPVRNFDLAIESYEQSLTTFRSNVPSSSIDTILAAYIEHGMPSYMWDSGPEGFKLAGGRMEQPVRRHAGQLYVVPQGKDGRDVHVQSDGWLQPTYPRPRSSRRYVVLPLSVVSRRVGASAPLAGAFLVLGRPQALQMP